jgi:hypothetical protein
MPIKFIFHSVFVFLLNGFVSVTQAQTIPSSRIVDWTHAGYEGIIPDSSNEIDILSFGGAGDSLTDNYPFIISAINSLNGNRGVIYFPAGNYVIRSTINLPDSVILRGASSDSTHLIFDFSGVAGNSISIQGSAAFPWIDAVSGFSRGSSYLTVANSSGFSVNDFAEIQEDNGTWDSQPVSWASNSVGQIIKLTAVSADTLFFTDPLRIDYDSSLHVQVRKFIPARETGIECMNLYRRDSVASGLCINIYFDHAVNCWVRGVENSRSVGSHIEADASAHLEISGNYIHHSFAYDGVSTHGYGITLFMHTSDCKVENNVMNHLRHSFSLQCGANGNVIAYNYSTDPFRSEFPSNFGADISLHGHYPYSNLFEGNIVQNIMIDQTWGPSGPFNTFFRNRAELYGIIMTSGTMQSDSQNFVGNEITNLGPLLGNYMLAGSGHFEYGNNVRGNITPTGTTLLNDSTYYLNSRPAFWTTNSFPSVGEPVVFGSGSVPAKDRFGSGSNPAVCSSSIATGIHSEFSYGDLVVYPNPAGSFFNIQLDESGDEKVNLVLTDLLGNKLAEKNFLAAGMFRFNVPVNIKPGIYFLFYQSVKGTITKKIILY